jgi:RNA polymerase sigma-70 factor (ECF subfamily)
VPQAADLPARLGGVLAVVYLIFNEGYLSSSGAESVRDDLCLEAIRLARLLRALMPTEPEITGLLALMLLIEARRPARVAGGELVTLGEQDRGRWDRGLIEEGHSLVRDCLEINRPGHYQLLAAINAVHTDAPAAADTDWGQIAALYDALAQLTPTPVIELNRAVALSMAFGPEAGLEVVDTLVDEPTMQGYHLLPAVRGDLLDKLGRRVEARRDFERAADLTRNTRERAVLLGRAARCAGGD